MSRTVKGVTVKAFHHPGPEALRAYVPAFVAAYDFARHLETLRWRTPSQVVCDAWKVDPSPFKVDPRHPIPGPYSAGDR
jgi:hypothetical protein